MPPKGYQSLGEELISIAIRLPASIVEAVDAHIPLLHAQAPWARVNRADALRDLVHRGLQQAHQEGALRSGAVPPSTGPALLGMEQAAPAPPLPPVLAPAESVITPLQQVVLAVPAPQTLEGAAAQPAPELENSIDLGGSGFDESKFVLSQKLCRGEHEYGHTGKTLLRLPGRICPQCVNAQKKQKRALQREGKG